MAQTVKIHMIANAHLDPVWLWSWQAGVDEALATAYTTVKILKEYPEVFFTRSDVWFHQIVEKLNPELFDEMAKLISAGQWQIVGGWYVQPDCNLPTEFGFKKHIEAGKKYFAEKFGREVTIGYNVDSFGHAGSLSRILAREGYKYYIYMRPGAHEKDYPSDSQIFWWQASDSEDKLLTYRIPSPYCCNAEQLDEHIKNTINSSDCSLGHIMCFFGVGDHGGGPTREQIEFIRHNKKKYDGFELIFSHPQKYFDAIADKTDNLPTVKGELQHHAVGCYSVLHPLKKAIKSAEHKLVQAQDLSEFLSQYSAADTSEILEKSWEDVLFNQFHDTHGGTCLKSAYPDIYAQLGRAYANADNVITETIRKYSKTLNNLEINDIHLAYFAVANTHREKYTGWLEHELFSLADKEFKVIDNKTLEQIPIQRIRSESIANSFARILLPITLEANEVKVFSVQSGSNEEIKTDIKTGEKFLVNKYLQIEAKPNKIAIADDKGGKPISLKWSIYEDLTDTWSHNALRLGEKPLGRFESSRVLMEESGPLRAMMSWCGEFDKSQIIVKANLYHQEHWAELRIKVIWNQPRSVLKMELIPDNKIDSRIDGIAGGRQQRALDGKEYPFADWTILKTNGGEIALISPDIFGFDAQAENARFTLLRSPVYAHHHPSEVDTEKYTYDFIDIGEHEFRILIGIGDSFSPDRLRTIAYQLQEPAIHWDPPYRGRKV